MAKAAESAAIDKVIATAREEGKHAARQLRLSGLVPAVLYGHGESRSVAFTARTVQTVQAMPRNHVFALDTEGLGSETVRLVSMQREATTGRVLHLDLERVVRGERARASVDVHVSGEEELAKREGVVTRLIDTLEVEGETMHLPSAVTVDASTLEPGARLTAGEIPLPAGVSLLTAADTAVVQVSYRHAVSEPAPETPAAEAEGGAAAAEADEGSA